MASPISVNELPAIAAALHRRKRIRWKEAGKILPEKALYRLDGVTPGFMLPGVMRARTLGFHGLAPAARFDLDDRGLAGLRLTPRFETPKRPLDGLVMTLVASEGLDQTIEGLKALRDTASPGDTLAAAIEQREGETVADLTALNTLLEHTFGASRALDQANAEPSETAAARDPEPQAPDTPNPKEPRPTPGPSIGL